MGRKAASRWISAAAVAAAWATPAAASGQPSPPPPGPGFQRPREAEYLRHFSALQGPLYTVVRNQAAWGRLWTELNGDRGPPTPPPEVDFQREMLLLAAMGPRPTGGYRIEIQSVRSLRRDLVVRVVRTSPGRRCGAIAAVTHPTDFVIVPRSAKRVRWDIKDVRTNCP